MIFREEDNSLALEINDFYDGSSITEDEFTMKN